MKILHTSDWHLGRMLHGKKRYEEFEKFLEWLVQTIQDNEVDVLLVAGDVFDTSTPSNRSQEQYYRFLCQIAATRCRNVIITAGNHDSPTFLNAPRELLKVLNVHVVGAAMDKSEDEVILLKNSNNKTECIVCAVPYLRDRDIRTSEAGEGIEDKQKKLLDGIRNHYDIVIKKALEEREKAGKQIPVVVMGHLFTVKGEVSEGDGVRELYVGSLAHVSTDFFCDSVDYVALGHLHIPQKVAGSEVHRYSGSPLPIGFGEAKQNKSVCLVTFNEGTTKVDLIEVPVFQKLTSITGTIQEIEDDVRKLKQGNEKHWIEIVYNGKEVIGDLRQRLYEAVEGTELEILKIHNRCFTDQLLTDESNETLDNMNVHDVFRRCLDAYAIPEEQRTGLVAAFEEIVTTVEQIDVRAE